MKRRTGQAGRIFGEALHQIGRIFMLLLSLVLLAVCVLGFRLSFGPLQLPALASWLATALSGQGISVRMQAAELAWQGYHQGGGVPLYLRLGNITVRNAEGVELASIPEAKAVVLPASLIGASAPILVSGTGAQLPGVTAPVSLRAVLRVGAGFTFSDADLAVTLGPGRLGLGTDSLPIQAGSFDLSVTPHAVQLSNGTLKLTPAGASRPMIGFSGGAAQEGDWRGRVTVTADAVQAGDLPAYWPADLAPATRLWVTRNIRKGTARNAIFSFGLTAPSDLAGLSVTSVSGGFDGAGLTLTWLGHAVPFTALNGHFALLDRNTAQITASSARLGGLNVSGGEMTITGLSAANQIGQVTLGLDGTIPDVTAIFNAPPMNLLRTAPPAILTAQGTVGATVTATLPLLANLRLKDVDLHVHAALGGVVIAAPIPGLGLRDGSAQLDATTRGVSLRATAQLAGEPATLDLKESFAGGPGGQDLILSSRVGPALLHHLGLDRPSSWAGPVQGTAAFTMRATGSVTGGQAVTLDADLTPAAFSLPYFGWAKPVGAPGSLHLTARLRDSKILAVDSFQASGPDLDIAARAQVGQIVFTAADIGRTEASGTITLPGAQGSGWAASFSGPVLDMRPGSAIDQAAAQPAAPAQALPSGPAWRLHLAFQQLDLAARPAPALSGFTFTGSGQGDTLLSAQAAAAGIGLGIAPLEGARVHLHAQAVDTGLLLRALGAYDHMQGGGLELDADYGGGPPAEGLLTLQDFRLLRAPDFTKVMQGLTVYGLPAAASGPGLYFERAIVPFSLAGQTLQLNGARAFSTSIGFTASGSIALADGTAKIDGTIVPAYALNTLLGKIPLLGHLFTAEKGGGLFAVRAHISGKLSAPVVRVNALSALTPGLLRGIFGLDEGMPGSGAARSRAKGSDHQRD